MTAYTKKIQQKKIFAYGFDKAGFEIPAKKVVLKKTIDVEFIPYDSEQNLAEADGVIIPQGIFERIDRYESPHLVVDEEFLPTRNIQIKNLLKKGNWVCFLVGEIIDGMFVGFDRIDMYNTDLCKKILLDYDVVYRHPIDTCEPVTSYDDEFKKYMQEFGGAKTSLGMRGIQGNVIATTPEKIVGIEFDSQSFFLPFHTASKTASTTEKIVREVISAIFKYRQIKTHRWLNGFKFKEEEKIDAEIQRHVSEIQQLQEKSKIWKRYKTILVLRDEIQDAPLKEVVITILENFFKFMIDPSDYHIQDFKITDEHDNILALVETTGTKGGVDKGKILQADSHRKPNGLSANTPVILMINTRMDVFNIAERLVAKISKQEIARAKEKNVLVIRTIDFLHFMKLLEEKNYHERQRELISLMKKGGGWLKANTEGYELIDHI